MSNRVKLVGMTLCTTRGQAQPCLTGGRHAIDHGIETILQWIDAAFFVEHGVAMKARRDAVFHGRIRQQVAGNLTNSKLIIVPFNATPIKGITSVENFIFKRNLGMPTPETVVNATVFLAINMNFEIIHLYGVEQSWLKNLSISNDNSVENFSE